MNAALPSLFVLALASVAPATTFYVSGLRGRDTNQGTIRAPFRTITKAIGAATANDDIVVLPGRYSASFGEKFPLTIPAGVDVVGTDPRSCVIDGEFDPRSSNNRVTGTLVRIQSDSRFAYLSVIQGARNPDDPGKEWWKVAIHVEGQSGNSANVEIDHVIVDEVSRGIVCGFAAGDHDIKEIRIHDCVIQRFYVEGINSWVNNGAASGNQIWNCTVAGHMRTQAPVKPFARAAMSFGKSAQFDVRSCVVTQADWAGIEAGDPSAKITSDYNCLHGGAWTAFVAHRGLSKGTNDLFVDPELASLPTVAAAMDPHQTTPRSPLWNKGINYFGQSRHFDIDYRSRRVVALTVDIGVDELAGPDAYFVSGPRLGRVTRLGVVGRAQSPTLIALGFASLQQGIRIPGYQGELWIDPTQPIVFAIATKGARGYATLPLQIPNAPGLLGLVLAMQGIDLPDRIFSDLDLINVTN